MRCAWTDAGILSVDGVAIRTLDIEGLLETKPDYRAKDGMDREVLQQLRSPWMDGWMGGARVSERGVCRFLAAPFV